MLQTPFRVMGTVAIFMLGINNWSGQSISPNPVCYSISLCRKSKQYKKRHCLWSWFGQKLNCPQFCHTWFYKVLFSSFVQVYLSRHHTGALSSCIFQLYFSFLFFNQNFLIQTEDKKELRIYYIQIIILTAYYWMSIKCTVLLRSYD